MADIESAFVSNRRQAHSSCCRSLSKHFFTWLASVAMSLLAFYAIFVYTEGFGFHTDRGQSNTTSQRGQNAYGTEARPETAALIQTNIGADDINPESARLVLNTSVLPAMLAWTIESDHAAIGQRLKHVTHNTVGREPYDCLKVERSGYYLVNVQLTFNINKTNPAQQDNVYFNVIKFSENKPTILIKHTLSILSPDLRAKLMRESRQTNGLFRLANEDKVCITTSDVSLLYPSLVDNYFSISRM